MSNFLSRLRYWWVEGDYPLTKALILINILTLIVGAWAPIAPWLMFSAPDSWRVPWTALTYPLYSFNPIGLLFYGLFLWFVGGSLERSWGTRFFAIYFFLMAIITAVGLTVCAMILRNSLPEMRISIDNTMPLAALFIAWCMLNPNLEVRLYGIIPILAKWMALGTVLIILFSYGRIHPLAGVFALSGCAASYWWVRTRAWRDIALYSSMPYTPRPIKAKKPKRNRRDDDFSIRDLNPLERIARARRRKQFARLIEEDEELKSK